MIKSGDTKEDVLRLFSHFPKTEPENMEGRDFSYVVHGEPLNGIKPDYDKIKYIAFQVSDTIGDSVFIDAKARKVYFAPPHGSMRTMISARQKWYWRK